MKRTTPILIALAPLVTTLPYALQLKLGASETVCTSRRSVPR